LITLLTITANNKGGQEVLRTGLDMGADDGILVEWPSTHTNPEPLSVSKAIQKVIDNLGEKKADLIICDKELLDDDSFQVGGMVLGLLDYSLAQYISNKGVDDLVGVVLIGCDIVPWVLISWT
jgi:electron transfer flavoprotein beta subunit